MNSEFLIDPLQEYEDHIINELCPDPDRMTYEQILALQDEVGYVSKGFSEKEIQVKYLKIENTYRKIQ